MLQEITKALSFVLNLLRIFFDHVLFSNGSLHRLLPLLGIGIAVTVIFLIVKIIKSFVWGT